MTSLVVRHETIAPEKAKHISLQLSPPLHVPLLESPRSSKLWTMLHCPVRNRNLCSSRLCYCSFSPDSHRRIIHTRFSGLFRGISGSCAHLPLTTSRRRLSALSNNLCIFRRAPPRQLPCIPINDPLFSLQNKEIALPWAVLQQNIKAASGVDHIEFRR